MHQSGTKIFYCIIQIQRKKSVHVDSLTFSLALEGSAYHYMPMADSREAKMDRYVGKQVRAIRNQRRLSQQSVADHLKLSKPTYGDMERGKHRFPAGRLFVIAEFFDVPVSSFFPKQKTPATPDLLADMRGVSDPRRTRRAATR